MTDLIASLTTALAGRYTIEGELGAGGMATVYLAHDVKHDRKVALKVLRPELAAVIGAERFLAEIKTTANLQHPNILPLHDSGEVDGTVFYVMPLIEGESLRDRLEREKQLPIGDAVGIASEVASALDYAHRHNVIHRDIKPENILLHDRRALVADFGIALAASRTEGDSRLTETGMSLGTPHYMSPEQAMGEREIDARTDIYAIGSVLYEMLTGEPPFTGPTVQSIVAKVLSSDPEPITTYRKTTPLNVVAAVQTALQKLPADRFATAAKFAEALADSRAVSATPSASAGAQRRSKLVMPLAVVTVVMTAIAVWGVMRPAPPGDVIRYALALPASQAPDPRYHAIPTPDGSRIVYAGLSEGIASNQLWVKDRDKHTARPLAGTLDVNYFTISPDGEWVAFVTGGDLKKVPIDGGSVIPVVTSGVSTTASIAWLDDGNIVFARPLGREIAQVSNDGGELTALWSSDSATVNFVTPLPHARGFLFQSCVAPCADSDVLVYDFRSGEAHHVVAGALGAYHVPTGHIVYVRPDGVLFAVPFDLRSLEIRGSAVAVLDSVSVAGNVPLFAVSQSGMLVLRTGTSANVLEFELVWVDQEGRVTIVDSTQAPVRMTGFAANYGWALSPDGGQLAIGISTVSGDDIWLKPIPRGPLSKVTYDASADYRPRWTPDGQYILFNSARAVPGLYRRRADGSGEDSLLVPGGFDEGALSPDGQWYILRAGATSAAAGGRDLYVVRVGVDTAPRPLLPTPYDEHSFALSPDGSTLAYVSDETGRPEVFVRRFPNVQLGAKRQVSHQGGLAPLWSHDGRQLYYINPDWEMLSVIVTGGNPGESRTLFRMPDEMRLLAPEYYTPWDVATDGRFIMARSIADPSQLEAPLVVVENWFEELKEKLGN